MHLLSLKDVNQLHLLLEGLEELISLPFKLAILINESILVSPDAFTPPTFIHFRLAQGQLKLLNFFLSPVQLGVLISRVSLLISLISFLMIDLLVGVGESAIVVLDLFILLGDLVFELRNLKVQLVNLVDCLFIHFLSLAILFLRHVNLCFLFSL